MSRTRDFSFAAGVVVFVALLLGAQPAAAEPPLPGGPTEFAQPVTATTTTTTTATTRPKPNVDLDNQDLAVETRDTDPTLPTAPATPTGEPTTPTDEPTNQAEPAQPARPVPTRQAATPTDPASIPTPNRIDTGSGGGSGVPEAPTSLFWVVPGLALLTLGAGLSGWWLARSEQDRR